MTNEEMDCGLPNTHNTCWLNTLFQCYSRTPLFQWLNDHRSLLSPTKTPIAFYTADLMGRMGKTNQISFLGIREFLQGVSLHLPDYLQLGAHHDIAEVSAWWLDAIYREFASSTSAGIVGLQYLPLTFPSFIRDWVNKDTTETKLNKKALQAWHQFHLKDNEVQWEWTKHIEGLMIHQIQCLKCRRCFHNFEPFQCISLEPAPTLEKAFECYFRPEILQDWTCDDCKVKTPAERLVRIWKAPATLVIQLKRFNGTQKLTEPITFPLEFHFLEDTELCLPPTQTHPAFDLMAIGNHHGTLGYGHYNTWCRSWESKNWVEIDDEDISPLSKDAWWEKNKSAYLLFYVRRRSSS